MCVCVCPLVSLFVKGVHLDWWEFEKLSLFQQEQNIDSSNARIRKRELVGWLVSRGMGEGMGVFGGETRKGDNI